MAYTAWARRAEAHPEVAAVLAAGDISESFARTICTWTGKLPEDCRQDADAILLGAAAGGAELRDLAGLAAEIYARSLPEDPGKKQEQAFEDRSVRLETTFEGAGVLSGELSPECAAIVVISSRFSGVHHVGDGPLSRAVDTVIWGGCPRRTGGGVTRVTCASPLVAADFVPRRGPDRSVWTCP